MAFKFTPTNIPDVILVEPEVFGDERGFFVEIYKQSAFAANGIDELFVQFNHSKSARNVLRGLHYQRKPKAQGKLVMLTAGEVFDVAVDIRRDSPTRGQWVGVHLNAAKKNMLYVPVGFAHGFCVLSETAEMLYGVTDEYDSEEERGIKWDDPDLAIDWPVSDPLLSDKDKTYPSFKETESNF